MVAPIREHVRVSRHGAGKGCALYALLFGIHGLVHDEERYQHRHGGDGETPIHDIGHQRDCDVSALLRDTTNDHQQQRTHQTWGKKSVTID